MADSLEFKTLHDENLKNKVCVVVGTRPGIVMFSPIIRELQAQGMDFFVIHTGQHYSYNMDRKFFEDLKLEEPHYKLDNMQNYKLHGEQTAEMLKGCERILIKERPKVTLVGGDANTNLAAALAARKLHIRIGHVEAGERSGDWRMPEEHNRVMIDHISEYLFTTNDKGKDNLVRENVQGKIFVTGNTIVDAALQNLEIAQKQSTILEEFNLQARGYFVLTMHREENVDSRESLVSILEGMKLVIRESGKKIVFLAHPRTQNRIQEFGLEGFVQAIENFEIKDAVGYLDFLRLLANADLVLTDSGGVQQESCILRVPCVTLRTNTEWVETLQIGANTLCGTDPKTILEGVRKMTKVNRDWSTPFGDGSAASSIVSIIRREVGLS